MKTGIYIYKDVANEIIFGINYKGKRVIMFPLHKMKTPIYITMLLSTLLYISFNYIKII